MKGKIYKNKLTTTYATNQHLNTDISSIYPNCISSQNPPLTPMSLLNSPKSKNMSYTNQQRQDSVIYRRPSNGNNEIFLGNENMKSLSNNNNFNATTEMFYPLQKNRPSNFLGNTFQEQGQKQFDNSRYLKKIVSNPNLTSYQWLLSPENNQQDQNQFFTSTDPIQQNSLLNKSQSSLINLNYNNTSKVSYKPKFDLMNFNIQDDPLNMNLKGNLRQRQISKQNKAQGSPIHNLTKINGFNSNSTLQQGQNLLFLPPQGLKCSVFGSEYVAAYQKRHKERIQSLEMQHSTEIQFLEEEIKTKDELIQEMKKMLKQKQSIIKRLQEENTSLSSRSYVSFANNEQRNF